MSLLRTGSEGLTNDVKGGLWSGRSVVVLHSELEGFCCTEMLYRNDSVIARAHVYTLMYRGADTDEQHFVRQFCSRAMFVTKFRVRQNQDLPLPFKT